tara:strand:+ start:778 stop:1140 length:363 start_codon:yes stop_codon:yes gene_type:complete
MKLVNKEWGYEIWIENNKDYCGKHLHVLPGRWCSIHYHINKKETFYIIEGELLLEYAPFDSVFEDNWDKVCETKILKEGDSMTLSTEMVHTFTSNTSRPCDFIEVSTFHEDSDSIRIGKK